MTSVSDPEFATLFEIDLTVSSSEELGWSEFLGIKNRTRSSLIGKDGLRYPGLFLVKKEILPIGETGPVSFIAVGNFLNFDMFELGEELRFFNGKDCLAHGKILGKNSIEIRSNKSNKLGFDFKYI